MRVHRQFDGYSSTQFYRFCVANAALCEYKDISAVFVRSYVYRLFVLEDTIHSYEHSQRITMLWFIALYIHCQSVSENALSKSQRRCTKPVICKLKIYKYIRIITKAFQKFGTTTVFIYVRCTMYIAILLLPTAVWKIMQQQRQRHQKNVCLFVRSFVRSLTRRRRKTEGIVKY